MICLWWVMRIMRPYHYWFEFFGFATTDKEWLGAWWEMEMKSDLELELKLKLKWKEAR